MKLIDKVTTSQYLTGSSIRRTYYTVETLTPMAMHGANSLVERGYAT